MICSFITFFEIHYLKKKVIYTRACVSVYRCFAWDPQPIQLWLKAFLSVPFSLYFLYTQRLTSLVQYNLISLKRCDLRANLVTISVRSLLHIVVDLILPFSRWFGHCLPRAKQQISNPTIKGVDPRFPLPPPSYDDMLVFQNLLSGQM